MIRLVTRGVIAGLVVVVVGALVLPFTESQAQDPDATLELIWEENGFTMVYPAAWGTVDTRDATLRRISPVDVATLDRENPTALLVTLQPLLSEGAIPDPAIAELGALQTYALIELGRVLPAGSLQGVVVMETDAVTVVRAELPAESTERAAVILGGGRAFLLRVQDPNAIVTTAQLEQVWQSVIIRSGNDDDTAPEGRSPEDFVLDPLEWVEGELTADAPRQQWVFTAAAGDYVAVYLTPLAEGFRPQVIVATAIVGDDGNPEQGEPLAVGQPSMTFPLTIDNVQLRPTRHPTAVDYLVTVETFTATGPYEMRFATSPEPIDTVEAFEFDTVPSAITGVLDTAIPLEVPSSVRGVLGDDGDDSFADLYRFDVALYGAFITVQVIADDDTELDTFVELYLGDTLLASNDDGAFYSFDAAIGNYAAPVAGTYYVRATNTSGQGAYTLIVDVGDAPSVVGPFPGAVDAGLIAPGQTRSAVIAEDTPAQVFTFLQQDTTPQALTIDVIAADAFVLDTRIWLYDENFNLLALNDDANGGTFNAQLRHVLMDDDNWVYYILVDAFSGVGTFDITLTVGEA